MTGWQGLISLFHYQFDKQGMRDLNDRMNSTFWKLPIPKRAKKKSHPKVRFLLLFAMKDQFFMLFDIACLQTNDIDTRCEVSGRQYSNIVACN